ncbi:hypothetical protein [Gordonia sp. NPDC003422]
MRIDRMVRRVGIAASVAMLLAVGACSSTTSDTPAGDKPTSVPMSASVTVSRGVPARTAPGTGLDFGATATLPADAFATSGALALFTVTGITPAEGVPETATNGGVPYFIYVTVTSLANRPSAAPGVVGIAGSPDGRAAALTVPPPTGLPSCTATAKPERMRRGESYATCLLALADPGQKLQQVIYWADTSGADAFDYKTSPVVWRNPAAVAPSGSPAPTS